MRNELDKASDDELEDVLITLDGRGKEIKKKALDILKERWQDALHENHE